MEIFPGISMDPGSDLESPVSRGHVSMWRLWWGRWRRGRVSKRCRTPMLSRASKFLPRFAMRRMWLNMSRLR